MGFLDVFVGKSEAPRMTALDALRLALFRNLDYYYRDKMQAAMNLQILTPFLPPKRTMRALVSCLLRPV